MGFRSPMLVQPRTSNRIRWWRHCTLCWLLTFLPLGCAKSDGSAESAAPKAAVRAEETPKPIDKSETLNSVETGVERPPEYFGDDPSDEEEPAIQRVVRAACLIPEHDLDDLAAAGIFRYESKRMILYTDIEPETARTLPPLIDQIYPQWEDFFRPMPPAADGSPFRIVGYLMRNRAAFERLRLTHPDLPYFTTGRHRGNRFWMIDQKTDYFRRHLMLHEATHCFMTIVPQMRCPIWYLEGTAELFGTHEIDGGGKLITRVIPHDREDFAGWGRISLVQKERDAGRALALDQVLGIDSIDPERETFEYAWCWAVCYFLDAHPRYRDKFRALRDHWYDASFAGGFEQLFEDDASQLRLEWLLFEWSIMPGYDVAAAAVDVRPGNSNFDRSAVVHANRGWQPSGWHLEAGTTYEISAEGRFTLAADPKPWISEPQGITVRYFEGKPLGRLVGIIIDDRQLVDSLRSQTQKEFSSRMQPIDLGSARTLTAEHGGTLYLRANDAWSELSDNEGQIAVSIRVADDTEATE